MGKCIVSDVGSAFALATGSVSNFSICAGLAGTTTLPSFVFPRFCPCYRPLDSFLAKVRAFALKGQLLPTFLHSVEIQLAVRRRTRAFPPQLRYAPSRGHAAFLSLPCTDERQKKPWGCIPWRSVTDYSRVIGEHGET